MRVGGGWPRTQEAAPIPGMGMRAALGVQSEGGLAGSVAAASGPGMGPEDLRAR